MSYGFQCVNGSNELTISSDAITYGYIGKAVYVSTTPPGTSTLNSQAGYSSYQITWPGDVIVAVGLPIVGEHAARLHSVSQAAAVWTINVFCEDGTSTSLGFDNQSQTGVYVWGKPTGVAGYGMALYDSSGNLSADLSRQPLSFNQRLSIPSSTTTTNIPAYTQLAIIGYASMFETQSVKVGPIWQNRRLSGAWSWSKTNSQLTRTERQVSYSEDDGGIPVSSNIFSTNVLLIEAGGLT